MCARDDVSNEDVERLLSGAQTIDEGQRLADVSSVVHALRTPGDLDELAGLDSALAAFRAAVVTTPEGLFKTMYVWRASTLTRSPSTSIRARAGSTRIP